MTYHQKYNIDNKDKIAKQKRDWQIKNQDKVRDSDYKRHYGKDFDLDAYNTLYSLQDGFCAVCGIDEYETGFRLCVEHSHVTGKIRSLACRDCNSALGLLRDDPNLLRRAASYLESSFVNN